MLPLCDRKRGTTAGVFASFFASVQGSRVAATANLDDDDDNPPGLIYGDSSADDSVEHAHRVSAALEGQYPDEVANRVDVNSAYFYGGGPRKPEQTDARPKHHGRRGSGGIKNSAPVL